MTTTRICNVGVSRNQKVGCIDLADLSFTCVRDDRFQVEYSAFLSGAGVGSLLPQTQGWARRAEGVLAELLLMFRERPERGRRIDHRHSGVLQSFGFREFLPPPGGCRSVSPRSVVQFLSPLWGDPSAVEVTVDDLAGSQFFVKGCRGQGLSRRCTCSAMTRARIRRWGEFCRDFRVLDCDLAALLYVRRQALLSLLSLEVAPMSTVSRIRGLRQVFRCTAVVIGRLSDSLWGSGTPLARNLRSRASQAVVALNCIQTRVMINMAVYTATAARSVTRSKFWSDEVLRRLLRALWIQVKALDDIPGREVLPGLASWLTTGGSSRIALDSATPSTVYIAMTPGGRSVYVGSTTRGGRQRQLEHRRDAEKWRAFQSGGARRVGKLTALPFHRKVWSLHGGMSAMVFFPLHQVVGVRAPGRNRDSSVLRQGSLVSDLRFVELCWQRALKPSLCSPWCYGESRPVCVTARRSDSAAAQGGGGLVDIITGERWNTQKHWYAQYQTGRLQTELMDESDFAALVVRLLGHGKQARSRYPVLRRLSNEQLQALFLSAHKSFGPSASSKVKQHVLFATKGRRTEVKFPEITVKDVVCGQWSSGDAVRELFEWVSTKVRVPGLVLRRRALVGKSLGKKLINEATWQARAEKGDSIPCMCQEMAEHFPQAALSHGTAGGKCSEPHLWTTLQKLLVRPTPAQAATLSTVWTTLFALLERLFPDTRPGDVFPVSAKTRCAASTGQVRDVALRECGRLLRRVERMLTNRDEVAWVRSLRLSLADVWRAGLPESLRGAEAMAYGAGVQSKLWQKALVASGFWVSTMDKGSWDLRVSCPQLAMGEIHRDMQGHFEPIGGEHGGQDTVLNAWRRAVGQWLGTLTDGGFTLPREMRPASARSLPKAKDPSVKGRLVVSHCQLPTAAAQRYCCKGVELAADLVWHRRGNVDSSVASWSQVRRKLLPPGAVRQGPVVQVRRGGAGDPGESFYYEVIKYDFQVFFMNAPQDQVLAAVRMVTRCGSELWGRNRYMRLVKKTSRPTFKALGQRLVNRSTAWHSPCGVGVVSRKVRPDSESVLVPLGGMDKALRLDLLTPLVFSGRAFRQVHGLAIGSPWGGDRLSTVDCVLRGDVVGVARIPPSSASGRLVFPQVGR